MIRALIALSILSAASVSFAAPACNTNLVLTCQATYQAQGQKIETATVSEALVDENWDEPSLANCAQTVYFASPESKTSVRIAVNKDLNSNSVSANSSASQIEDHIVDGQNVRTAQYSNTTEAASVVGQTLDLGTLNLPRAIAKGGQTVTEVSVSCIVK